MIWGTNTIIEWQGRVWIFWAPFALITALQSVWLVLKIFGGRMSKQECMEVAVAMCSFNSILQYLMMKSHCNFLYQFSWLKLNMRVQCSEVTNKNPTTNWQSIHPLVVEVNYKYLTSGKLLLQLNIKIFLANWNIKTM